MKKIYIPVMLVLLMAGCGSNSIESTNQADVSATVPEEKLIESEVVEEQVEETENEQISEEVVIEQGSETIEVEQATEETKTPEKQNFDNILVLVNKQNSLPKDYVPSDLVAPNVPFSFTEDLPKRYMRREAALALEQLFRAAQQENIELFAVSGYRSYDRQEAIFAANVAKKGEAAARLVSAEPGQSEHQTGLAMDVSSRSVGFDLIEEFGETKEGIWLKNNAHKFGFIIRYPKGKEDITGYSYEPWHIRYVGKSVAKEIFENSFTFEEYLSK
ncbi:M15 family metallopeptidase [Calidifontibacillus erzurumensis]|uniref:M15 family metallopeptidase n=1 Tax=Calidifontibacillus erzurumensis TaxID=2741433 RepID=A0A8J8GEZ6_9BACI|nr:M15 family metallopeptidase [Calidifontibacillus erzurumensis]NSL50611.1 M15 family metallopeptidase [Calidifontibacillus erzurumensis]